MEITVSWLEALPLRDGSRDNMIYRCDLETIPTTSGVYVFGRKYGDSIEPRYIGQATNLRGRIKQQLNAVKLMNGLKNSKIGQRIVVFAEISVRSEPSMARALDLVEKMLIEQAISRGHELINTHGTKLTADLISFEGHRDGKRMFSKSIRVPHRRTGLAG